MHGALLSRGETKYMEMMVIPLSRGMSAVVDIQDFAAISPWKWHALKVKKAGGRARYYAARTDYSSRKMILMHRVIMDPGIGEKVDHRDPECTLDNRRCNLRIASNMQNSWNSRKHPDAKGSRFKGVWLASGGKWIADITCGGKKLRLGRFTDENDAALAYDFAAMRCFGNFARLNFSSAPFTTWYRNSGLSRGRV